MKKEEEEEEEDGLPWGQGSPQETRAEDAMGILGGQSISWCFFQKDWETVKYINPPNCSTSILALFYT